MKFMNLLRSSTTAVALLAAGLAQADGHRPIIVTSTADRGDGSLRAALATTTGAPIIIATTDPIIIQSTLVYAETAPLHITGIGQDIMNTSNTDVLAVTNGANVNLTNINLVGPAGFSVTNRTEGQAGKGLFVDMRDGQPDFVSVTLTDVTVRDVAGHGIHISDCFLPDQCNDGGSNASVAVNLNEVVVKNVGNGRFDADGLRVDERGTGHIVAHITNSEFSNVGADGIELDEGQDGSVRASLFSVNFANNGNYCDATILGNYLPSPAESEYHKGETTLDAILMDFTSSPDDQCIEVGVDYYDDGSVEEIAFEIDLDDAFDIDETGAGDVELSLTGIQIIGNFDQGLDLDEEGSGSVNVSMTKASSSGNADDGYKLSEADEGNLNVIMFDANAHQNGGKGFVFEEEDDGDVTVIAIMGQTARNDDGDDTGIEISQDDAGSGKIRFIDTNFVDGTDTYGVTVTKD